MIDLSIWALFGSGALFAALCGWLRRGRPLWALLAAVCTAAGVLSGLALGRALNELLPLVLVVCFTSTAALLLGRRGGG